MPIRVDRSGFRPAAAVRQPQLSEGSTGPAVVTLQKKLLAAGFNPGKADGIFGPKTLAAVVAFQRARGLDVDGIVGPHTWGALAGAPNPTPVRPRPTLTHDSTFEPAKKVTGPVVTASGDLRERVLSLAQGEIGNVEARNRNDGAILKYPNYFGRRSEAWCADFVSWVMTHAGKPLNYASVAALKKHLVETGDWKGKKDPQPGDLVVFDLNRNGWPDHVGIVKSVNRDGSIQTIEGNTEGPRGREGVWERRRPMSQIMGFGNI
jgi:hypothetical protein